MQHTWDVIALLLFLLAVGFAGAIRAWALALLAAGCAAYIVPLVFH